MHHIGHRLEVPKHDDIRGWEMLYDQATAPRYGRNSVSEERNRENKHWGTMLVETASWRSEGVGRGVRRWKSGCRRMGLSGDGMMFLG
jgi:hypothetical protein